MRRIARSQHPVPDSMNPLYGHKSCCIRGPLGMHASDCPMRHKDLHAGVAFGLYKRSRTMNIVKVLCVVFFSVAVVIPLEPIRGTFMCLGLLTLAVSVLFKS